MPELIAAPPKTRHFLDQIEEGEECEKRNKHEHHRCDDLFRDVFVQDLHCVAARRNNNARLNVDQISNGW